MSIFTYDSYKKWLNDLLYSMPKQGRGQLKRIADHLGISPTIVTQVFNGDRELTPEQALLLADYLALSKFESRYLITLVNYARAGTHLYKKSLHEEILELRAQSQEIRHRVQQTTVLSEEAKTTLYSNWYYLAIWSLTAIPGFDHLDILSERLHIPKKKAREAIDFLLKHSLVIEDESGKLKIGPTLIHLEASSSQVIRHHQNWRLQAFRKYEEARTQDTFYTAPVTLSEKDAALLKEKILKFISQTVNHIKDSPSEKLYCLCVDWFEV